MDLAGDAVRLVIFPTALVSKGVGYIYGMLIKFSGDFPHKSAVTFIPMVSDDYLSATMRNLL